MHLPRMCVTMFLCAVLASAGACRPARGGAADAGSISISHAVVSMPPPGAPAPGFLVVANHGTAADTLLAVDSPDADSVGLHTVVGGQMQSAADVPVPTLGEVVFAPGGYHLMIGGFHRPLAVGDTLSLTFRFAHAGGVPVRAPVLTYSEAVSEVRR
jgi:copper(I)-binding protein